MSRIVISPATRLLLTQCLWTQAPFFGQKVKVLRSLFISMNGPWLFCGSGIISTCWSLLPNETWLPVKATYITSEQLSKKKMLRSADRTSLDHRRTRLTETCLWGWTATLCAPLDIDGPVDTRTRKTGTEGLRDMFHWLEQGQRRERYFGARNGNSAYLKRLPCEQTLRTANCYRG